MVDSPLLADHLLFRSSTTYHCWAACHNTDSCRMFSCSFVYSCRPEYHDHRWKRSVKPGIAESKSSLYEPDFRPVKNVIMEVLCICPGWYQHDHCRTRFERFLVSFLNPPVDIGIWWITEYCLPPPTNFSVHPAPLCNSGCICCSHG